MKTIGLIGGMSCESSAEYYRLINQITKRTLGAHNNARSLMLTVNFQDVEPLQRAGDWDQLGKMMAQAARQLEAGGADFVVLCTNTMHKVAPQIEAAIAIPFLHIVDATAAAIKAQGYTKVGLLATRFTMEHDFYHERLHRHGLNALIPDEPDRTLVHEVIYQELCHGRVSESSRSAYLRIVGDLQARGAQAVILGCTEITLLIKPEDTLLPVFDATLIHAETAVEFALGQRADQASEAAE